MADMTARKEAVMNNVRQELALANAQELMNVREFLARNKRGSLFLPSES